MRPDQRPMRVLPMLEARRAELEKCVYCPKLCRTACPVSNEEPRETLIPWGKMSMASFAAHGDVTLEQTFTSPVWACTGCHGCRESCDHKNDVAGTLGDARVAITAQSSPPEGALRVLHNFAAHEDKVTLAGEKLARELGLASRARTALLVGCQYLRKSPDVAKHAAAGANELDGPITLTGGCCGLPLLAAGDAAAFKRTAITFAASVEHAERLVVVDPGCAMHLRTAYPKYGVALPPVELYIERAARAVSTITPLRDARPVRYHDPCQLGRGLGVYEAPRTILARLMGTPPLEFVHARDKGTCSGAGGQVPSTYPAIAKRMHHTRIQEHLESPGECREIVTACGSSLHALRRAGEASGTIVTDLSTLLARGLGVTG